MKLCRKNVVLNSVAGSTIGAAIGAAAGAAAGRYGAHQLCQGVLSSSYACANLEDAIADASIKAGAIMGSTVGAASGLLLWGFYSMCKNACSEDEQDNEYVSRISMQ